MEKRTAKISFSKLVEFSRGSIFTISFFKMVFSASEIWLENLKTADIISDKFPLLFSKI